MNSERLAQSPRCETELQQARDETMRRMQTLRDDLELTYESMLPAALMGVVTNADASIIRDWLDERSIRPTTGIRLNLR